MKEIRLIKIFHSYKDQTKYLLGGAKNMYQTSLAFLSLGHSLESCYNTIGY